MRRFPVLLAGMTCLLASTPGHDAPAASGDLISMMSGCFDVTYRFVEDGRNDMFSPEYGLDEPVTEWIGLEEEDDGGLVLVHVGFRGGQAFPHFHEVWKPREGENGWRHEVWGPTPGDPEPELRYACESRWTENRWDCAAGPADKPFRDSGAPFGFDREDYDRLDRTNILLVTPQGWVHNEHNRKLTEDGELVSYELGWITYERVDEAECGSAPEEFPG